MRDSIEEAMRRLEERRIEPGDVIVPRAWAAALGQYYRRERTGTMHMILESYRDLLVELPRRYTGPTTGWRFDRTMPIKLEGRTPVGSLWPVMPPQTDAPPMSGPRMMTIVRPPSDRS